MASRKPTTITPTATLSDTGRGAIEIVRATRGLTREQFANSNLPGSEFARDYMYPSARPMSLGRMAGLGLLGGAVGFGTAHLLGKSRKIGAGIGAALGAGGSLAVDKMQGGDAEVIGAFTDEAAGGSLLIIGSSQLSSGLKSFERGTQRGSRMTPESRYLKPLFITKGFSTEPPGWAGVIVQHGTFVQAAQMRYVYRHAGFRTPAQVAPWKGFNLYSTGGAAAFAKIGSEYDDGTNVGVGSARDDTYSQKTLFTERFAEWPSPAFSDQASMSKHTMVGDLQRNVRRILTEVSGTRRAMRQGLDEAYIKYVMGAPLYHPNSIPETSSYYDSTPALTNSMQERYGRMVAQAQWFVWAGEMFRLHSNPLQRPAWWADHCAQWGVGCATGQKVLNNKLMTTYNAQEWCKDGDNPLKIDLPWSAVDTYLQLIVKHTPGPFTTAPNKQMIISAPNSPRMLMDMPENIMQAMLPPIDAIGRLFWEGIAAKINNIGLTPFLNVFFIVVVAVIEIIVTVFAPPIGAAGAALMTCFLGLALLAIQKASVGQSLDASDLVCAIGSLASAATTELDLDIAEWAEGLGGGAADFLASLESIAAAVNQTAEWHTIMDLYDGLYNYYHWDHGDAFMATLEDGGSALGLGIDNLNAKLAQA